MPHSDELNKSEEQHHIMKRESDNELKDWIFGIAIGVPSIIIIIYFIVS